MAAATRPGAPLAFPSSPTALLLLSRSRPSAPDHAASPSKGTGGRRRWLAAGVPATVVGALAASVPTEILRDGGATLLVTAGAYSLVRAFDALTERRLVEQSSGVQPQFWRKNPSNK